MQKKQEDNIKKSILRVYYIVSQDPILKAGMAYRLNLADNRLPIFLPLEQLHTCKKKQKHLLPGLLHGPGVCEKMSMKIHTMPSDDLSSSSKGLVLYLKNYV